jgi:hypothetical protein
MPNDFKNVWEKEQTSSLDVNKSKLAIEKLYTYQG